MSKISVIIPVYNDEAYISRCLESVCAQTIASDLEIIIVDDGSSDNSMAIAREVLECHLMLGQSRLIILEKNQGVANARKLAIDSATGDYIMSCDGDDWTDVTMCEKLLRKAESEGCDVVVCDYNKVLNDAVEPIGPCYKEPFLSQLIRCAVTGSLCNKLIKSSLLKRPDFVYPDHDFSEDYVYNIQIAIFAKKIGYVQEALYYYLKRSDSLVRSQRPECCAKRESDDEANYQLVLSILDNANLSKKYREELIYHKLRRKNQHKGDLKQWRQRYPELNHEVFESRYIPFKSKCAYLLRIIKSVL